MQDDLFSEKNYLDMVKYLAKSSCKFITHTLSIFLVVLPMFYNNYLLSYKTSAKVITIWPSQNSPNSMLTFLKNSLIWIQYNQERNDIHFLLNVICVMLCFMATQPMSH